MALQITYFAYTSPIGPLTLSANGNGLTQLVFGKIEIPEARNAACELTNLASTQLLEYLAGKRRYFDLPLDPQGSEFQLEAWRAIRAIPYAQTASCSDIAAMMGRPDSHRQVGLAAKANPLPIFIPDHRLSNAQGKPLGSEKEARRRGLFMEFERGKSGLA